jgi:hypothetical protein
MEPVWGITRTLTGIKTKNKEVWQLNINGDINYNPLTIPDFFSNYFLAITGKNHSAFNKNNNFVDYLHLTCNKLFPNIRYQCTSTCEIEKKLVPWNQKIHWVRWNIH